MDTALQHLRERFAQLEDEDLLRIVGEDASDYRPEAIELARQEIRRRGLENVRPSRAESRDREAASEPLEVVEPEEEPAQDEPSTRDWVTCALCGGGLRTAVMLAEHQIIAVFEDNREARYVKILVCPRCGNASMFVDMHTTVTE